MAESILYEYYSNEFQVVLSDSTLTPVFSPSGRSNALLYFEVCYKKNTIFQVDPTSKKEKKIESDILKVFLHYNQSKETIKCCTNVLYAGRKVLKICDDIILNMSSKNILLAHVNSQIFTGNAFTDHGNLICSGKVILKSKFYIGGHLGTAASIFHLKSTLNSQTEFFKNFSSLFESGILSDLTINVEDKTLRAHKLILSTHSRVFQKMFENDFLESKTNTLVIEDATFEVFQCFLKYLYSGELVTGFEKYIDDLYKLADKYDVKSLKADCVRKMIQKINMDNICELLPMAYDCNEKEIKMLVKSFAVENFSKLESTPKWKDLVKLHSFIGYDILAQVHEAAKFTPTKQNVISM